MTTTQVNDTIISLLESKGWHPSIGRAFCLGLEKSGRFTELREIVCGLYKTRVFSPRSQHDLDNPDRLYATSRRVISRAGKAKFYPPYIMNRQELLLFTARYPEVEVIHKAAKHDNPHAFHANCRHVCTELLLGYVREHSLVHGGNSQSITDVGGNEAYHRGKKRYVHCDTPVLSARDKARYLLREVYSGSESSDRCMKSFGECLHSTDFAIGVHSTYGMTPQAIAVAMGKRSISAFYGVIVIPTSLESLDDGDHSCDGTNIEVSGEKVTFTFPDDASAAYVHYKQDLIQYLKTRQMIPTKHGNYAYTILSLRGDTIFFSVVPIAHNERTWGPSLSVVPPMSKYFISIPGVTTKPVQVDSQPFDRMVLHAAGARNFQSYDIVSLYQYAKSLRASLTINNIILSKGYASSPSDVVTMVIAAYCVAASFKIESSEFFRKVTSQVDSTRGFGFVSNLYHVATLALRNAVGALFIATGVPLLYGMAKDRLDAVISGLPHVTVSVSPYDSDSKFVVDTTSGPIRTIEGTGIHVPQSGVIQPHVPQAPGTLVTSDTRFLTVPVVNGEPRYIVTVGTLDDSSYDAPFKLAPTPLQDFLNSRYTDVDKYHKYHGTLDSYAVTCNDAFNKAIAESQGNVQFQPVTYTKVRDSVFTTVNGRRTYVVRGYGSNISVVSPIPGYRIRGKVTYCVRYDYDITQSMHDATTGTADDTSTDEYSIASYLTGGAPSLFATTGSSTLEPSSSVTTRSGSSRRQPSVYRGRTPIPLKTESLSRGSSRSIPGDPFNSTDEHVSDWDSEADPEPAPAGSPTPVQTAFPELQPAQRESSSSPSSVTHPDDALTVSVAGLAPGHHSVAEFEFMNQVFKKGVISTCVGWRDIASLVNQDTQARAVWYALSKSTPSEPSVIEKRDGKAYDVMSKSAATCGGVVWNEELVATSKFLAGADEGEIAISCTDLEVFVVDGLHDAVQRYKHAVHDCEVVLRDAPAANGKTYTIRTEITLRDYVVCETRPALEELRDGLVERDPLFAHRCFTADSAIINDRKVDKVEALYIDEALRLHAGKIYILMRMLKPEIVICFGDSKQIPAINFLEGYDFLYNVFPFTSVSVDDTSRTMLPAFAMALSSSEYYNRHVYTHSKVEQLPSSFIANHDSLVALAAERQGTIILTYTQGAKKELKSLGLKNCMTIGESQGKRFDHVILARDSTLKKVLYYDKPQALVAVTRCRYSFQYATPTAVDDSCVAIMLEYIRDNHHSIARHLISNRLF